MHTSPTTPAADDKPSVMPGEHYLDDTLLSINLTICNSTVTVGVYVYYKVDAERNLVLDFLQIGEATYHEADSPVLLALVKQYFNTHFHPPYVVDRPLDSTLGYIERVAKAAAPDLTIPLKLVPVMDHLPTA